jgi:cell division protein FtsB
MGLGRMLRRRARAAVAPLIFLLLVAYFLWSATQGEHGLNTYAARQEDLKSVLAEQAQADADLTRWERRVTGLQTRIDGDALDERARAMLNLSDPQEVIVPYEKGQRLF